MKLYLGSTSAQAMISRLGPGRSKHISTRLLWSKQALRKLWVKVGRLSADKSAADLNTKALALRQGQVPLYDHVDAEVMESQEEEMMSSNLVDSKQLARAVA